MPKCKECLHCDLCASNKMLPGFSPEQNASSCRMFLDRSLYVPATPLKTRADYIRSLDDEGLADNLMGFFALVLNSNNESGSWAFSEGFRDDLIEELRCPLSEIERR